MRMQMNENGVRVPVIDRSRDRYFVTDGDGGERETDIDGYIHMERICGFTPKSGCGPVATGSFSSGDRAGRIEMWFEGAAKVVDLHGREDDESFEDCHTAQDHARRLNRPYPSTRFVARSA